MKKSLKFVGMSLFAALLILLPFASCTNSSGGASAPNATSGPAPTAGGFTGGGTSSGGQQQEDKATQFGGKPYDATIGNGGYNLHTFMGANTTFDSKEKADYYIGEAETYVKGLANQLSESTKNRPAAQAYFQKLFDEVQHSTTHYYGDGESFDIIINNVSRGAAQVMGDIVGSGLSKSSECQVFNILYRTIANEALKAGAGNAFDGSDSASRYNAEKNSLLSSASTNKVLPRHNIDLQQAYNNNDFTGVTNLLDEYLTAAATKIGHDVTADDLRKVVNIAMTTESFYGLHERTKTALDHWKARTCNVDFGRIKNAIDPSNYTYAMLNKQDNGIELC